MEMQNNITNTISIYQKSKILKFINIKCWQGMEQSELKTLLLLLLLLSHFSRVRLCATPETAAHQAPLSLGFSRQEHWSGLPFPSPVALNYDPCLHQVEKTHNTKPHTDQDNVLYFKLDRVHINLLFFTNLCTKHLYYVYNKKKCLIFCFGSEQNLLVSKISFISSKSKDFEVIIKTLPRFNILVICVFPN